MRRTVLLALLLVLAAGAVRAETGGTDDAAAVVTLTVDPLQATVGDPLATTIEVRLPADTKLETGDIGPELGPFTVLDGAWSGPVDATDGSGAVWTWAGRIAAYATGTKTVPSVRLTVDGPDGASQVASGEVDVEIVSVLEPADIESETPELADLKPPAAMPADYGGLWTALGILAALAAVSALVWWLYRRYAGRLAAAPPPEDPFRRTPPHVWVYAELQRLLDRRLPEQGQVDLFYAELSRITKRYLGGRYRVDLVERTTEEVGPALEQAGTPAEPLERVVELLQTCDRVKFARERPGEPAWRSVVDRVYGIVDATRPAEDAASPSTTRPTPTTAEAGTA